MDFGENNLTGTIPQCFGNLHGMTGGDSNLYFFGGFEQSVIQVMRGVPLEYTTIMRYVVNMDLSSNRLVGEIPNNLTLLSGLLGLNLSNNHLTGQIPARIGDVNSLMSLDLSGNDLIGTIPQSISSLTSLSHLNLSNNNLSGRIPTGSQLQTLIDPSIYAGNNELCGSPLPKRCERDEAGVTTSNNGKDDDDIEMIWVYAIASGFATGFIGILGVLALSKRWRLFLYSFVEVKQK
ncbi:leucine-rich repeat protein [Artemisia annua]|uniref:Leucine-rich repeat protein n=1 Tax=Artemisia annua TaxID=35608 RepID=A0A2U1NE39_ARTAN|nr:leucine-rich repeat protein [Artemisia annua]